MTGCLLVMHLMKRPKAAYILAFNLWSTYAWHNNVQIVYMNSMSFKPPCTIIIESRCAH
jgi:hypothetical protein